MFKRLSALLIVCCALTAQAAPDPALVRQLADEDSSVKVAAIQKLTQTADPDTARIFQAMADNNLYLAGDRVVIIDGDKAVDAVFGVIYPPQVALVGFGTPAQQVVAVDGGIRIATMAQATLSADHRASDGHRGALFLAEIARLLQDPDTLEE